MCIGVPAKVLEIGDLTALVDVMGSKMKVGIIFVPEVKINEYVLIHAGQAMAIVDEEYAKSSMNEWRRIIDARDQ